MYEISNDYQLTSPKWRIRLTAERLGVKIGPHFTRNRANSPPLLRFRATTKFNLEGNPCLRISLRRLQ